MEFHEIADIFPLMEGAEFESLVVDISANGLVEPVWVWEGKILDGRNRWNACAQIGIEPKFREYLGNDPEGFVVSANLHRRHLNAYQRSIIALKLKPVLQEEAKEHPGGRGKLLQNSAKVYDTRKELASLAKVSHDTISKVETIAEKGTLQQRESASTGKSSINTVYKEVVASEKKEERKRKTAEAVRQLPELDDRYRLICGDLRSVEIDAESIDVIITDPPYPKEYLPLYEDLAKLAAKVLRPGGSLVAMTGHSYLPEIINLMTPHIKYYWTACYLTLGGSSPHIWQKNVNTFWKPLLWFVKGEYKGECVGDVCKSQSRDKQFHDWGQSESGMADIVERFSRPGDVVMDPFMGSGTTGVVALQLNRRFVGIDIDPECITVCKQRIAEAAIGG
ncbi:MAG: DNA adenine methyltransferase YhdJ [Firmicutes bacterium]|nr:DNA adenine methyltransferase YhdJ [Bacillota bacterium]